MPTAAPAGIGNRLRDARLARALSLEEIAWRMRIRPDVLRSLENEAFESIGHNAFVRSHLTSYARFLGLDPADIVDEFTRRSAPEPSSIEQLDHQRRVARKPPRAKWPIAAALSAALLAAGASLGIVGGQTEQSPAPISSPEAGALDRPGFRVSREGRLDVPYIVPAKEANVHVEIEAIETIRVTVLADGQPVFDRDLRDGSVRTFRARDMIEVSAPDGSSIRLIVNDKRLGFGTRKPLPFHAAYGPRGLIR